MKAKQLLSGILVIALLVTFLPLFSISTPAATISETDRELIGFGYNITSGKPLSKSSLLYSNPILDIYDEELMNKIFVSNYLENKSANYVADSARELAEQVGSSYAGGIQAQIKMVTVDIGAKFDKQHSLSNSVKERYEMYYQTIARRQVVIQMSVPELREHLSDAFERDVLLVRDEDDAIQFLNMYGTHLFTGYILGGRMDITNYKVTNSSTVDLNQTVDLKAQVGAAAAAAGAGVSFSITEQYGSHENTSNQKSLYNFSSTGGEAVAALTIDHLFTYNSSVLDGKGNYEYARWAYAINEGKNLDIIDAANGTNAIPVWELLPQTGKYADVRTYLISAYAKMCGDKYDEYKERYPYISSSLNSGSTDETLPIGEIYEYQYSTGSALIGPIDVGEDAIRDIPKDALLFLGSECTAPFGEAEWKIFGGEENAEVVDSIQGVVRVTGPVGNTFSVALCYGENILDSMTLKIKGSMFSGGLGTESDPYLISTVQDLSALLNNSQYFGNSDYHFLLINDIDASTLTLTKPMTKKNSFAATLDGGYHTIRGLVSEDLDGTGSDKNPMPIPSASKEMSVGLIGYNSGTIRNLRIENTRIVVNDPAKQLATYVVGGCLVGINIGVIENCSVAKSHIDIEKTFVKDKDDETVIYHVYAGGIVGYNVGTITGCGVDDVDVKSFLKLEGEKDLVGRSAAGGFVGVLDAPGLIENCYVIYDTASNLEEATRVYACVDGDKSFTVAENRASGHAYAGALVGWTRKTSATAPKISCCIVDTPLRLWAYLSECSEKDEDIDYYAGTVIGRNEGISGNTEGICDCYVLSSTNRNFDYANEQMAKVVDGTGDGTIRIESSETIIPLISIKYPDLKERISSDIWCDNGNGYAATAATQSMTLKVAGVNEKFNYGNSWTPSGMTISYVNKLGQELASKAQLINLNGFDPNQLGAYLMTIGDVNSYYASTTVIVEKCDVHSIVAWDESTDTLYSESFYNWQDRSVFVEALLTNGQRINLLAVGALNLDYVNYPTDSTVVVDELIPLVIGQNEIFVRYGDFIASYMVEAEENSVIDIALKTAPKKLKYPVGSVFSGEGMEVSATYGNGDVVTVEAKDLEIIGTSVFSGTNKFLVAYGGYNTLEIEVEGYSPFIIESFPSDMNYVIGETINWDGAVFEFTSDGVDYFEVPISECSVSAKVITAEGINIVNVNYNGYVVSVPFDGVDDYSPVFIITFVGYEGIVLSSEAYHYGDTVNVPVPPSITGYSFAGWSEEVEPVTANKVYVANYTKVEKSYTITFIGHGGAVLKSAVYKEGEVVNAPAVPVIDGYTFVSWDKEIVPATQDAVYVANYVAVSMPDIYTVVFLGHGGAILSVKSYKQGDTVEVPNAPAVDGYTFNGWSEPVTNVTANKVYIANYTKVEKSYTITFIGHGGAVLKSAVYKEGEVVNAPAVPVIDGYTFVSWDKEIVPATQDAVYVANYVAVSMPDIYTVVFLGHGGAILSVKSYKQGDTVEVPNAPAVDGYTFNGWSEPVTNVTANKVYVANYVKNDTTDQIPSNPLIAIADADGNGKITREDAILILQYVHFSDVVLHAQCDIDGDKTIDTDDVLYLINYLTNPDSYPIG